jgi:2',3'-cyclic-nucleotide 2'-phosphodiesterase / 3'-nucleotidase
MRVGNPEIGLISLDSDEVHADGCGMNPDKVPVVSWERCLQIVLLLGLSLSTWGVERVQVSLLATTDVHGHLLPYQYSTGKEEALGLAKVSSLVRKERERQPNLLLLDCGDLIQGTPLTFFHARKMNHRTDPMTLAMNAMGYDAFVIGNHEFNYGLDILRKAESESRFPWLSANTHHVGTETPAFTPYAVKTVAGVRIGIIGLTTPGIPNWENPPNYEGLSFADPVAEAVRWEQILRRDEAVDVVVAIAHLGVEGSLVQWHRDPDGMVSEENPAVAVARAAPGIDVLFMGHTHREVDGLIVGNTLLMQALPYGRSMAKVDLYLEREGDTAPWKLILRQGEIVPVTGKTPVDPEIVTLAMPYHESTEQWLSQEVGLTDTELKAGRSRLEDTALIDLIHRVQLELAQAEVSIASSFSLDARLPQGAITIRDLYGIYRYENTLLAVELSGAQIRDILEHSARYFLDGAPDGEPRLNPSIPGYNFDTAEGVEYRIDLSQPVGNRIRDLRFQGEPLAPERKLRVAVNNYRFNGGGNYPAYGDAPVLWRSSAEIRDLIIDWVERHRHIPVSPNNNWKIVW